MQLDRSEQSQAASEYIAEFIAEKLKDQLIIDAMCRQGDNLIQVRLNSCFLVVNM